MNDDQKNPPQDSGNDALIWDDFEISPDDALKEKGDENSPVVEAASPAETPLDTKTKTPAQQEIIPEDTNLQSEMEELVKKKGEDKTFSTGTDDAITSLDEETFTPEKQKISEQKPAPKQAQQTNNVVESSTIKKETTTLTKIPVVSMPEEEVSHSAKAELQSLAKEQSRSAETTQDAEIKTPVPHAPYEKKETAPIPKAPDTDVPNKKESLPAGRQAAPSAEATQDIKVGIIKEVEKTPIAPIKSYTSDSQYAISHAQTGTMAQILESARIQEQIKKNKSPFSKKNLKFLLLSVVFILIATGIFAYFIIDTIDPRATVIEKQQTIPSIIAAESHLVVDTTNASVFKTEKLTNKIITEHKPKNEEFTNIYFTEEKNNQLTRLGADDLFAKLNITMPNRLSQVLARNFMYGTYMNKGDQEPFFILKVTSFDRALTGMKEWEATFLDTFNEILLIPTEKLSSSAFLEPFVERVIDNTNMWIMFKPDKEEATTTLGFLEEITGDDTGDFGQTLSETTFDNIVGLLGDQQTETSTPAIAEENGGNIEPAPKEEPVENSDTTPDEIESIDDEAISSDKDPENRFAFVNSDDVQLLYTFIDEETLIITTSPDVVKKLKKSLADQQIFTP